MNYRHAFHAGNFADVTKHLGLLCLLDHLRGKDKPYCVLETHAGRGSYDLQGAEARRSREADGGILRLAGTQRLPGAIDRYLELVRSVQPAAGRLRYYPGSPEIIHRCLREPDRAVFCELQPDEAAQLRSAYAADRRVAVHHRDGYEAIGALLPPQPRRGFVFIDPPYEVPDEFDHVLRALKRGQRRWPEGTFTIWYPLKDVRETRAFRRSLGDGSFGPVMTAEFTARSPDHAARLNGSGLAFVRPPWRLDRALEAFWPELPRLLGEGSDANARIRWLTGPDQALAGPAATAQAGRAAVGGAPRGGRR